MLRRAFLACVLALGALPTTALAQSATAACNIRTTERVVAIGDIHGAYDGFVSILRETGLLDARDRWIGGRAILVQTGDVLDRGADSRKALDLLRRLERDAERAGGKVWALIGNHELMRMIGDWRYVSAGEYAAFRSADSRERQEQALAAATMAAEDRARRDRKPWDERAYREQFLKDVPMGFIEMREAFSTRGDYGRWLRTHVAAVTINGILYVHGGISPDVAARGCRGINEAIAADLKLDNPTPDQGQALFGSQENGPLWYRGLTDQPDALSQEQVDAVLSVLQVRVIVIGHTVTDSHRIETRYGGKVIQIDTGMLVSVYEGGVPSALEVTDKGMSAVYAGRPRTAIQ